MHLSVHVVRSGALACLSLVMAGAAGPAVRFEPPESERDDTAAAGMERRPMDRFRAADRDRDGAIDREEFRAIRALRTRSDPFDRIDADGDGRIDVAEFVALVGDSNPPRTSRIARRPGRPVVPGSVERRSDVVYAPEGDPVLQSLDLYLPSSATDASSGTGEDAASTPASRPVLVMVHGGGWKQGDKTNTGVIAPKAAWAVDRGWVFVSVNYRLSPAVRHPEHAKDVAAAIAWVRDHASEFQGDPERIVVMGHSAGAHLAAIVATDRRLLDAHGMDPAELAGVVLLDGAGYDIPRTTERTAPNSRRRRMVEDVFGPRWEEGPGDGKGDQTPRTDRWRDASPRHHIVDGRSYPPMLVVHQRTRPVAAVAAGELVEALRGVGGRGRAVPVDKDHAGCNQDLGLPDDELTLAVAVFLDSIAGSDAPSGVNDAAIQSR